MAPAVERTIPFLLKPHQILCFAMGCAYHAMTYACRDMITHGVSLTPTPTRNDTWQLALVSLSARVGGKGQVEGLQAKKSPDLRRWKIWKAFATHSGKGWTRLQVIKLSSYLTVRYGTRWYKHASSGERNWNDWDAGPATFLRSHRLNVNTMDFLYGHNFDTRYHKTSQDITRHHET